MFALLPYQKDAPVPALQIVEKRGAPYVQRTPEIWFCVRDRKNHGFLSNFYPAPFVAPIRMGEDVTWPTSEHYYAAHKTPVLSERRYVLEAETAAEAKKRGTKVSLIEDWPEWKVTYMRHAVSKKFGQNLNLRRRLLATGSTLLVEDAPWDPYWGIGKTMHGMNMLGNVLMELRASLAKSKIVLVTGDRNWYNESAIIRELAKLPANSTVIHGAARGADTIANNACRLLHLHPIAMPAQWELHGRAAGPIRNQEMLDLGPELVLAFHEDLEQSKGTRDMVNRARKAGVEVRVFTA